MTIVFRADGSVLVMYRTADGSKASQILPSEASAKAFVIAKDLCKCPGTFVTELDKAKVDMEWNGNNAVEFGLLNDTYMYTIMTDELGRVIDVSPTLH